MSDGYQITSVAVNVGGHWLLDREFKSLSNLKRGSPVISPHYLRRSLGPFSLTKYSKMAAKQHLAFVSLMTSAWQRINNVSAETTLCENKLLSNIISLCRVIGVKFVNEQISWGVFLPSYLYRMIFSHRLFINKRTRTQLEIAVLTVRSCIIEQIHTHPLYMKTGNRHTIKHIHTCLLIQLSLSSYKFVQATYER